jgi:hypothetical protein
VLVIGAVVAFSPLGGKVLSLRPDREDVWRNSLDLATDYPVSGVGLGNFSMAYSSYVLLLHVPYTTHAHNLPLDIWLEQGVLGLAAFLGMTAIALQAGLSSRAWGVAGLVSLGIVLTHGVVDDPFYGYGGVTAALLFIPFGLLARQSAALVALRVKRVWVWGTVAVGLVASVAALPAGAAILVGNLGTLLQTQIELSRYHWPEVDIQDIVRRQHSEELGPVVAQYEMALQLDPANATANRRLGQIELSLGHYDAACQYLQAAFNVRPEQRATRQLLGECYAQSGDAERAAALWRTLDLATDQLSLRLWWYEEYLGDYGRAQRIQHGLDVLRGHRQ